MKKISYITLILFLNILIIRPAHAIWPDFTPLIPVAPQLCVMCTPAAITEVSTAIQQVNQMRSKFDQFTNMSSLKKMLADYTMSIGKGILGGALQKIRSKKQVISYSRTIEECEVADITNEASVKQAFIKLFLQYPSRKTEIMAAYKRKGEQFKIDTTLEMYITAREMEKELKQMITELDNIERCIVAGEDCSEQGMEQYNCQQSPESAEAAGDGGNEDNLCLWRNAVTAVSLYDKIMRYNEFLIAMNAQYQAVKGIDERVAIMKFTDLEEDQKKRGEKLLPKVQDNLSSSIAKPKGSSGGDLPDKIDVNIPLVVNTPSSAEHNSSTVEEQSVVVTNPDFYVTPDYLKQ